MDLEHAYEYPTLLKWKLKTNSLKEMPNTLHEQNLNSKLEAEALSQRIHRNFSRNNTRGPFLVKLWALGLGLSSTRFLSRRLLENRRRFSEVPYKSAANHWFFTYFWAFSVLHLLTNSQGENNNLLPFSPLCIFFTEKGTLNFVKWKLKMTNF